MADTTFDLTWPPNAPQADGAAVIVPEDPVQQEVVAGRYVLESIIGRGGGGGMVWQATDTLTGEQVALKRFPLRSPEDLPRVRREIAAVRWLQLPGVVHLRDSGLVQRDAFLVMDRVDGRPFPGAPRPMPWATLAPTALALLEILGRVHHYGVTHRDLKPANVLVDRAGQPVVLDFGLALGRALTTSELAYRAEGTPAYVAPEQLRGRACDARTDLYALGCMLYEALTGAPPHGTQPLGEVVHRRLNLPPPRLLDAAPHTPPEVAAVIDQLLARDPDERPASAAAVIEALGGASASLFVGAAGTLPMDRPATPDELRALFRGPDPLLHLAEDGAAILHARTGGEPRAVLDELSAWVRAGLAHWEGDRLVIQRAALDRLAAGLVVTPGRASPAPALGASPEAELGARLTSREPASQLLPELIERVERLLDEGRGARALALLELGLDLLVELQGEEHALLEDDLLRLYAIGALRQETEPAMERAIYELLRATGDGQMQPALVALLQGCLYARRREADRAEEALRPLAPFDDEELEIWRVAGLLLVAQVRGPVTGEHFLEGLGDWARGSPAREARLAGWWGNLYYQQGRFSEAAQQHFRRWQSSPQPQLAVAALVNASTAALAAHDLDLASEAATLAVSNSKRLRHARYEAVGVFVLRSVAYRSHEAHEPDAALIDAAAALGPYLEAILALVDATTLWRAGVLVEARRLATRSSAAFQLAQMSDPALLMTLLAAACGDRSLAGDDLTARALRCGDPSLALQCLALLGAAQQRTDPAWRQTAARQAEQIPPEHRALRQEILSVDECLTILSDPGSFPRLAGQARLPRSDDGPP